MPKEVGKLKPGTTVSLVVLRDSKELDIDNNKIHIVKYIVNIKWKNTKYKG